MIYVCSHFPRGRSARVRGICFGAAVAVYVFMFGIARMHHPLSWLAS